MLKLHLLSCIRQIPMIVRSQESRMIDSGFFLSKNRWSVRRHCPIIVTLLTIIVLDGWESSSHHIIIHHAMTWSSISKVSVLVHLRSRLTSIILKGSCGIVIRRIRVLRCVPRNLVVWSVGNWLEVKYVSLYIWNRRVRNLLDPSSSLRRKWGFDRNLCFWLSLYLIVT